MRQKKHGSYANHITSGSNDRGSIKKERAMRNRTGLLIIAIIVLGLLAVCRTGGAVGLTHNGVLGKRSSMMSRQEGDQRMMRGPDSHWSRVGGYQQTPLNPR